MIDNRYQTNRTARRRGSTLGSVLLVGTVVGSLAVSTLVIAPRFSTGGVSVDVIPIEVHHARSPRHQQSVDDLATIIGGSASVLAIHPRGASPYAEIVLWLADANDSHRPEAQELAIISHSRIMRTVKVYRMDANETAPNPRLARHRFEEPAFCDSWRSSEQVTSEVLVSGVSDLDVEELNAAIAGTRRFRLSLRFVEQRGMFDIGEALIDALGKDRP